MGDRIIEVSAADGSGPVVEAGPGGEAVIGVDPQAEPDVELAIGGLTPIRSPTWLRSSRG